MGDGSHFKEYNVPDGKSYSRKGSAPGLLQAKFLDQLLKGLKYIWDITVLFAMENILNLKDLHPHISNSPLQMSLFLDGAHTNTHCVARLLCSIGG